jgi:hypothetical protein
MAVDIVNVKPGHRQPLISRVAIVMFALLRRKTVMPEQQPTGEYGRGGTVPGLLQLEKHGTTPATMTDWALSRTKLVP